MTDYIYYGKELFHHGTKGQKWGVRNYQNEDGSYTSKGQAENSGHGRYSNAKSFIKDKANKVKGFKLSDKQKKFLRRSAVVGFYLTASFAVTYGLYKIGDKSLSNSINKGKIDFEEFKVKYEEYLSSAPEDLEESIFNSKEWYEIETNKDMFETMHSHIVDDLSDVEKKALKAYTGPAHSYINKALRGISNYDDLSPTNKMLIEEIRTALNKCELKESITLYRGLGNNSYNVLESMTGLEFKDLTKENLIGLDFYDKGFTSTSDNSYSAFNGIRMHINAPKGTKAAYLESISKFSFEKEVLLQSNTRFIIKDVKQEPNGIITDLFCDIIS